MKETIQKISRKFTGITAGGSSICMMSLCFIIFFNSIRRYTIGESVEFGEELPIYIAIYGVMFGMVWAYMQGRHIQFTILVGFLPKRVIKRLYVLVDFIMIINGVLLTYSGWMFVKKRGGMESSGIINLARDLEKITGSDSVLLIGHMGIYQSAIAIGGILLTIAGILKLLQRILGVSEIGV